MAETEDGDVVALRADEIKRLRETVDILSACHEAGLEDRELLRNERDEARAEVERAEPRRQRDERDIADAYAEIARLRTDNDRLDALVLDWIGREVLSPDLVADVAAEARRLAEEPQPACDLDGLRAEERTLAATVARLTLALETAPDVPELAARLRSQSDRLRAVRRELSAATRPATPPGLDVALVEGAARLRELLARDTAAARDVLALVLDGRLRVRWEGPRRPVWITGAAELRAELSTQGTLASPEGYGRPLRRVTLRRAA